MTKIAPLLNFIDIEERIMFGALIRSVSFVFFFITTASAQEVTTYYELCDASAAVALGPDHFVVAEDERDTLRIFRRDNPTPVGELALKALLGNDKEADIEGAAIIGHRIFWIASHGMNKDGLERLDRRRLFATDVDLSGKTPVLSFVGVYKNLLADLIAEDRLRTKGINIELSSGKGPETETGLNIEGLAANEKGELLIAFRNPRTDAGEAIVIPLLNPEEVIKGVKAKFGNPDFLYLDGKGIRSIERVGEEYLIVAGPFGPSAAGAFQVYTWKGPSTKPQLDETKTAQLRDFRPEALFEIPGAKKLQILSDDGDDTKLIDGKEEKCGDWPRKQRRFRSKIISLQ